MLFTLAINCKLLLHCMQIALERKFFVRQGGGGVEGLQITFRLSMNLLSEQVMGKLVEGVEDKVGGKSGDIFVGDGLSDELVDVGDILVRVRLGMHSEFLFSDGGWLFVIFFILEGSGFLEGVLVVIFKLFFLHSILSSIGC